MEVNVIYNEDCLIGMKRIPNKSVDLIVTDPPYNIGKAEWDKIPNYIEWMGTVFLECQRVLKDNGSFYWFHNDMPQIAQLMEWIRQNTKFVFKQLIVWNKKYKGVSNEGFLQGFIEPEMLRNYQKMVEYCLYYTFQDDFTDNKLFFEAVNEIQGYVKDLIYKYGGNVTKANEFYCNWSGKVGNYRGLFFGKCQPVLYTEQQYTGLCEYIKSLKYNNQLKSYEEILEMCNKRKYKSLRYTFNNQKTHHSVWNYEIAKKRGHITPKPVELIENIIKHSSNEGDIVLDCFMGSGTTEIAALNTNRNYIGFEKDKPIFDIATRRIQEHTQQVAMI